MIYLASRSPRRRVLLRQMKVQFRTLAVDVDEDVNGGEAPASYVIRIARAKASQGWSRRGSMGGIPVLGADTAVVVSGEILGKPKHHEDAQRMLGLLSNRSHRVLTAVAIAYGELSPDARLSTSVVSFKRLTPAEIDAYCATGEPLDKAGAYAIQGVGGCFVSELTGSYSGVMGLPLFETAKLLRHAGIEVIRTKGRGP